MINISFFTSTGSRLKNVNKTGGLVGFLLGLPLVGARLGEVAGKAGIEELK
jgi:hypothetical protein